MALLTFLASFCLMQSTELAVQETLRVDYVLIDLLVLDKNNQPVQGLTLKDFVVKENGKAMDVDTFQVVDFTKLVPESVVTGQAAETPVQKPLVSNQRQQFIFALDQESLYLTEIRKSFTQFRNLLESGGLPKDADYLLYSMESGVLTQGFVSNLDHFIEAVNQFEDRLTQRYGREVDDKNRARRSGAYRAGGRSSSGNRRLQELAEQLHSCLSGARSTASPERKANAISCVRDATQIFVEDEEFRLQRVLGELEALAYRFEVGTGQKRIFLVSPGFSLSPGQQGIELASYMMSNTYRGGLHQRGDSLQIAETMTLPSASSFHKEFQKVVHACTRNRVVFHSLDLFSNAQENASGLDVAGFKRNQADEIRKFYSEYLRAQSMGLERLATTSGGFYARSPNMKHTIDLWMPRLQHAYLLGYASPEGKPGKYRKIKIKCKKRGTELHYRRGYFSANGS